MLIGAQGAIVDYIRSVSDNSEIQGLQTINTYKKTFSIYGNKHVSVETTCRTFPLNLIIVIILHAITTCLQSAILSAIKKVRDVIQIVKNECCFFSTLG